jgi:(E)-4-hydroxy-3-methylbut-2-enyl-diphosphate synthase
MTKTDTRDVQKTMSQLRRLERAGCEIVRISIPDSAAAKALRQIKQKAKIPVIADIHFDYRLALEAVDAGADALRINPGNIGSKQRIREVAQAAQQAGISIRVGVNAGSLEQAVLRKFGGVSPEAMVESAVRNSQLLEESGLESIKISLKASDVVTTINAYRLACQTFSYPLHVGITEAGTLLTGTIYSAVGIGVLLAEGIGDTIRVSLTAPPEKEVEVGFKILQSLGLRERGVRVVSCPTCARCEVDVQKIATQVETKLSRIEANLTVAVMGCAVNGPGEAKHADVGVACGKGSGLLFARGEVIRKVKEKDILLALLDEVQKILNASSRSGP